jgi:hypothetical protein
MLEEPIAVYEMVFIVEVWWSVGHCAAGAWQWFCQCRAALSKSVAVWAL